MKAALLIVMIFLCLTSCVEAERNINSSTKAGFSENNFEKIDNFYRELSRAIAIKYYDIRKKPIINIYVSSFSSDFESEPYLSDYLENNFRKYINDSYQFKISDPVGEKIDSLLVFNIEKIDDVNFALEVLATDVRTGSNVFKKKKIFNINLIDKSEYEKYKNESGENQKTKEIIGKTKLALNGYTNGDSVKAKDKYYLYTIRSLFESESYLLKKDTGLSGIYPGDLQISVNGSTYLINSEGIFFDEAVFPGNYKITASFREKYWDGYNHTEKVGRVHKKEFTIDVKKDQNIVVDILFFHQDEKSGIVVKAKNIKKTNVNSQIIDEIEPVDVFY
jgi:hypothetical protein